MFLERLEVERFEVFIFFGISYCCFRCFIRFIVRYGHKDILDIIVEAAIVFLG